MGLIVEAGFTLPTRGKFCVPLIQLFGGYGWHIFDGDGIRAPQVEPGLCACSTVVLTKDFDFVVYNAATTSGL